MRRTTIVRLRQQARALRKRSAANIQKIRFIAKLDGCLKRIEQIRLELSDPLIGLRPLGRFRTPLPKH